MSLAAVGFCLSGMLLLSAVAAVGAPEGANQSADKECPDLSSPRAAALAWIDAAWDGDIDRARQILVPDDKQLEAVMSMLHWSAARRELEAAGEARFGEAGRKVSGYPDGSATGVKDRLKVSVDGDVGTAELPDSVLSLKLRKQDGLWRVDLTDAIRDPRFVRAARASSSLAKVARDVAAEIKAGRFADAGEARGSFTKRRRAAVRDVRGE